mgnify:CR=1 FL=1
MDTTQLNEKFRDQTAQEILEYFINEYGAKAALSSSLGAEDQVITDMMLKISKDANIFTLDTGRLHPETYNVMDATNLKYGIKINVFFPDNAKVEALYKEQESMVFMKALKTEKGAVLLER